MTNEELKQVLADHDNFTSYADKLAAKTPEDAEPPIGIRAVLNDVNLEGRELKYVNLAGADMVATHLERADLRGANLANSNIMGANLSRAALNNADLRSTNLEGADLSRADLRAANLEGANLKNANLSLADLRGANLFKTNLEGANLGNTGLLLFQFERHPAYYMGGETLNIGGATMTVSEWQAAFPQAAIDNAYTTQQTEMYTQFIEGLSKSLEATKGGE